MKKQLLTLSILGMLISFTDSVSAQQLVKQKIMNDNGGISLIVFDEKSSLNEGSVAEIFKDILQLKPSEELRLLKSERDFTGKFTDVRYQLYQNNIKVEGGVYILHYQNGKLISMNGEIFQDDKTITTPGISATSAFQKQLKMSELKNTCGKMQLILPKMSIKSLRENWCIYQSRKVKANTV